jgi:hypothetical protein
MGATMDKVDRRSGGRGAYPPGMPMLVLTGEALDLSFLMDKHWEPVTSGKAPTVAAPGSVVDDYRSSAIDLAT